MERVLWEKDLVAVYRLDQKSQRKQEETDMGPWQQKREGGRHQKDNQQHW